MSGDVTPAIERLRLSSGFMGEQDGADVLMLLAEVERLLADRIEIAEVFGVRDGGQSVAEWRNRAAVLRAEFAHAQDTITCLRAEREALHSDQTGWYVSASDRSFIVAYEGDDEWVAPSGVSWLKSHLPTDLVRLVPVPADPEATDD